jgi:hypothetical protein
MFDERAPQNWHAVRNPWKLPRPPVWFLKQLYDRDPQLVVFPGVQANVYRLARRSRMVNAIREFVQETELQAMIDQHCIPVTTIVPTANWVNIFQWLDDHDTWKAGGANKYVDAIEAREREAQAKVEAEAREEAEQRAISGYHALLNRTGRFHIVPGVNQDTQSDEIDATV